MYGTLVVLTLVLPLPALADKLPTEAGLRVSLTPDVARVRIGDTITFRVTFTDDDAAYADGSLDVQGAGGSRISIDGACQTPLDRKSKSGGVEVRATFRHPGKYRLRAKVATGACYGATGLGSEHVVVMRTGLPRVQLTPCL